MRKRFIAITILCVMLFSGCVKSVDISPKENTLIAEYAAGLLIKNSNYYKDRYYFWDEEDVSQEIPSENESSQDETDEAPSTINPDDKPTDVVEKELAKVFGLSQVALKYDSYVVVDRYNADPEGYFELVAETGYDFVVVKYVLSNNTGNDLIVDNSTKSIIVKAGINNEYMYNNYDASILLNDLTNLKNVKIASGDKFEAVIIFMVPSDVATSIEKFSFTVLSGDTKSQEIFIK